MNPGSKKSLTLVILFLIACAVTTTAEKASGRQWLAGDHHIHSRYSVDWDRESDPPSPKIGGEAIYPIPMNALMARRFGLSWTVATDHGGPNHSRVNFEKAYPELLLSRELVPEVVQFYGMELNSPGADHSSLIVPHGPDEADNLRSLESGFDRMEAYPADPARNTEDKMVEALGVMSKMTPKPVVIANHPSRTATEIGVYGLYDPSELRKWHDAAPEVAVGMAGAPGHQAITLNPDGSLRNYPRGAYQWSPTIGGFDQLTARLGGFWDSMLGEGRHWWITANSDSHIHYTEGGYDFWPGEYSKTYVFADKNYHSILEGVRTGQVFVTTGDLVSEVYVTVRNGVNTASIGGTLQLQDSESIEVQIKIKDPGTNNSHGDNPMVRRIDLIVGDVRARLPDDSIDTNDSTHVANRFTKGDWRKQDGYLVMSHNITGVDRDIYLRVRGTNTSELEPEPDPPGEDPWQDLWFYSNPVFVERVEH